MADRTTAKEAVHAAPEFRCREGPHSTETQAVAAASGKLLPHRGLDLTGRRFGKLTVLRQTEKRMDQGSVVWLCQCDCGRQKEVSARRLTRGKVRSCGCLSDPPPKDYIGKRFGRLTVTEYGGRTYRRTERSRATINLWKCRCDCGKEVTVAQPELQSGDTQSCGCLQPERAREALRLIDGTSVTILESVKNNGLRKTNKSGHTGVCLLKSGYYEAYISFQKRRYYLGRNRKLEDAVRAREAAEAVHDDFLAWYYSIYPETGKQTVRGVPGECALPYSAGPPDQTMDGHF